jgi:hypothetical protein
MSIRQIYPEFRLEGAYTTSLDPYVPLWALIPFFSKIVVGITPYLRSEDDFRKWYGISVRQLLALHEEGRVVIRVLFPSSTASAPSFLNPFFSGEFPSTARDRAFDERLLGAELAREVRGRFKRTVSSLIGGKSVDGFPEHEGRAYSTAEMAYLQLHALGYEGRARQFEELFRSDPSAAMKWLELCRLFLVGPYHYSLLGIHSVANNVPTLEPAVEGQVRFPAELGRILVDAFKLVDVENRYNDFTLRDCMSIFPDFELARGTLLSLDAAVKSGQEKQILTGAEDFRRLVVKARSREKRCLRWIRWLVASGISIAGAHFHWVGLLAGLGVGAAAEFASEEVDHAIKPISDRILSARREHLNLILKLDDEVRRHFRAGEG